MIGIDADLATGPGPLDAGSPRPVVRRKGGRLVAYTAMIGGRHRLLEPAVVTPGCRYVCFTDQPFRSETWEIVRVPPSDRPRKASRYYKLQPHRLFETEYSFWIDASFRIAVDPDRLIERHMPRAPIAAFAHFERDCTYELAKRHVAAGTGGDADVVRRQMCRYRSEGFPEHAGLWNGGALLRRHTPEIAALNDAWWHEYEVGSDRDELSFGYCTWRLGVPVATIRGHTLRSAELQMLDNRVGRSRSEYDPAEWAGFPAVRAVAAFPDDLDSAALEYGGIYADGWLDDAVFVGLEQADGAGALVVRGMVPLVDDPAFATELRLLVDGREVARATLGLGDFEIVAPVTPRGGRRDVRLFFSEGQILPEERPRRLCALLRFIGFQPVDARARPTRPPTRCEARTATGDPLAAPGGPDARLAQLQAACEEQSAVIDELARAAGERLELIAKLEARNAALQAACDERLLVIEELARAAEERLRLVQELDARCRELERRPEDADG